MSSRNGITCRAQLIDDFVHTLSIAQSERKSRIEWKDGELEWVTYERKTMLDAVNAKRSELGKTAISDDDLRRAENNALGHFDYARKFALYCTFLVENP
jgi:hypothetical protein